MRLAWAAGGVEVSVVDSGGDGADAGLPSGGLGLTSMAERAALHGAVTCAPGARTDGFAVRLWLPGARMRAMTPRPGHGCSSPTTRRWSATACPLLLGLLPGIEVVGTAVRRDDAVRQARRACPMSS